MGKPVLRFLYFSYMSLRGHWLKPSLCGEKVRNPETADLKVLTLWPGRLPLFPASNQEHQLPVILGGRK